MECLLLFTFKESNSLVLIVVVDAKCNNKFVKIISKNYLIVDLVSHYNKFN